MLPASIRVAPNSPKARAKARVVAAKIPGNARGTVMRQKIFHSEAPRVLATCRTFLSICSKAPCAVLYISGKETTVAAIAAPYQVKTTLKFKDSISCPSGPFFPNSSSNKKPTTVGGKIRGETKIPSTSDFPLPRYPSIQ